VPRVVYQDITRAVIQGEMEGFAKIIAERASGQILGAATVGVQAGELIGESAVAMARRVSSWRVGDTQPPSATRSELIRWTADQVRESSRSAAEQASGMPIAMPHRHPPGSLPTWEQGGGIAEHIPDQERKNV